MATVANDNVDYRLLNRLSNLVLCSHCLRAGRVTPVPQLLSKHHRPHNVCTSCRHRLSGGMRKSMGKVLPFPHK